MNGVLNVLKPPGMSSSGVVVFLRRILGEKKIGHAGTLDPGAAGVLPICMGRSTRLSDYLMEHQKTYIAELAFGVGTDTLDSYGEITSRMDCRIEAQALAQALPAFVGEIEQIPPMYSAVNIDGQRAYALARKGAAVERKPRKVRIASLELRNQTEENRFLVEVRCSKGTYIRTLAEDIGRALGVPAHISFLLRSEAGGLKLEDALTLDEIRQRSEQGDLGFLLPPEQALGELPCVALEAAARADLEHGRTAAYSQTPPARFRLYCEDEFYGVGRPDEGGVKLAIPLR